MCRWGGVGGFCFSDRSHDILGYNNGDVVVLCMKLKIIQLFEGHLNQTTAVAMSWEETRHASGSCDGTVRVRNVEEGSQIGETMTLHTDCVTSVAISGDRNGLGGSGGRGVGEIALHGRARGNSHMGSLPSPCRITCNENE